jgi:hypothetical protein
MIWRHRGVDIPLEVYHGVPRGWSADEIFAAHALMHGTYSISDFEIGRWAAPSWMPQRYEWLRYKETLNRVAEGIRAGDDACSEIAIRYIELQYIGSYSGFIRTKLARALRHAKLDDRQKSRLNEHLLKLVLARDYAEEFREYWKLWRLIVTERILEEVVSHFRGLSEVEKPAWLPKLITAAARSRSALR